MFCSDGVCEEVDFWHLCACGDEFVQALILLEQASSQSASCLSFEWQHVFSHVTYLQNLRRYQSSQPLYAPAASRSEAVLLEGWRTWGQVHGLKDAHYTEVIALLPGVHLLRWRQATRQDGWSCRRDTIAAKQGTEEGWRAQLCGRLG